MKKNWISSFFSITLCAIGCWSFSHGPLAAEPIENTLEPLTPAQTTALNEGEILVNGENGSYTARVVVPASIDEAWEVLTDYGNFTTFLPNTLSSEILEVEGDRYVVEQVSQQQILFLEIQSRIRTENLHTQKERIDFNYIEGDLEQLQGYWTIEQIPGVGALESTDLLITQVIEVQPSRGTPEELFNDIFQDALENNLEAIREEVIRRQSEALPL
ncbi:SRPBCC family protein [Oscillatoriales cyanobacterium LEGE 11467]|uniref:SRPBCC family protein n=1 Tax=Zarconia navalis LEGE 11467 TaxID=1828826 RepID=A0A928VZB6_9CYAN|nr:SRPBCC family protein [Zarconia navalis]MBE9040430.1 SRPBCC family protein [Zarconia navalis LEGE 11467]